MPKIHRDRPPTNRYDQTSEKTSRITVTGSVGSETELAAQIDQALSASLIVDPSPPPRSAGKAEWVAYADSVGIDASGTKTQIVERVHNG